MGVDDELTHLPNLDAAQLVLEGRHSRQADPVDRFPIAFTHRIDGHATAFKHLSGLRKHHRRVSGRMVGQTVANRALFFVDLGSGEQIRPVGGDRWVVRVLIPDTRIESQMGQFPLKRHHRLTDRYWSQAGCEVEVSDSHQCHHAEQNSNKNAPDHAISI